MSEHVTSVITFPVNEAIYLLACKRATRLIREEIALNGKISMDLLKLLLEPVEKEERSLDEEASNDQ